MSSTATAISARDHPWYGCPLIFQKQPGENSSERQNNPLVAFKYQLQPTRSWRKASLLLSSNQHCPFLKIIIKWVWQTIWRMTTKLRITKIPGSSVSDTRESSKCAGKRETCWDHQVCATELTLQRVNLGDGAECTHSKFVDDRQRWLIH